MKLIDSGHILGSRSVLIDDAVCYTGDMSARSRAFLEMIRPVKCEVLIVESTFGTQRYVFPPVAKIVEEVNRIIAKLFANGVPVVLMGYSLGKAQILSHLFGSWSPLYVEDSVSLLNDTYRRLGIELPQAEKITELENSDALKKKPWLMIAPLRSGRSSLVSRLKRLYGAVTVGFTGWSIDPGYKFTMGLDYAFPLSDHADFQELSQFVHGCSPDKVYTVHGFTHEFAAHLRRKGFDAEPLGTEQRSMKEFLKD
jgi:putative mRNA 3-end processing factor